MKEREKCKKKEPSPTSMRQMVLKIIHFKVRNLGKMKVFSLIFDDVTHAILQDNEKIKGQYLRSLLCDLFETLQDVGTWQRNFASFQFCCYGNQNRNYCLFLKKQKV